MEEDQGVRVTRLRRRLSVEQTEDISSPAATPTKKRVAKLPKPALDHIAENAVVDSPKRTTRRSIALDPTADEVVTPGKKSRGKANTSLLSDSIQGAESPRVTRTTRRNSLAGNENESTVLTPVRRSRRISKDSPEAVVEMRLPAKKSRRLSAVSQDVIAEENEKEDENLIYFSPGSSKPSPFAKEESNKSQQQEVIQDETSAHEKTSPTSVRKSPRLSLKKNTEMGTNKSIEETSASQAKTETKSPSKKFTQNSESVSKNRSSANANGSISDFIQPESKGSKKRSKSFTLLEQDFRNESRTYYSDSECKKLKSPKKANILQHEPNKIMENGNTKQEVSPSKLEENKENLNKSHQKNEICSYKSPTNISGIELLDKTKSQLIDSVDGKKVEGIHSENKLYSSITSNIIMEESDYNEEKNEASKVTNIFYASKKTENENADCEPMDFDEVLPENCVSVLNDKSICEETKLDDRTSLSAEMVEPEGKINSTSRKDNTLSNSVLEESIKRTGVTKTVTSPKMNVSNSLERNVTKEPSDAKRNLSLGESGTPIPNKALHKLGPYTSTPVTNDEQTDQKQAITSKLSRQAKIDNIVEGDSSEKDSSDEESEEQETLVDNEAEDAGEDYRSGDSQNESDREHADQNEIPVKGETLDSQDDEESNESDYEKDSFVVSSDVEDEELLSGSGDDLSLSDNELKMSKKSKEKYNNRKGKEQKKASREMFEARHGTFKENISADESDDTDGVFTTKNKKRNRLRLDSSKDTSNTKVCDEPEMTINAEASQSEKDPLMNALPIKQEVSSANNTVVAEIENVELEQDVTIFANKEDRNPLESSNDDEESDSESSDDGGIADNYDSLLKDLNSSKDKVNNQGNNKSKNADCTDDLQKNVLPMESSFFKCRAPKDKKVNSSLDKLNVTTDSTQSSLKSKKVSRSPEKSMENIKDLSNTTGFLLTSLTTSMKRNESVNTTNDSLNTSKKSKKEKDYTQEEVHKGNVSISKSHSLSENVNTSKTSKKNIRSFVHESGEMDNTVSDKIVDSECISTNNDSSEMSSSLKISKKTKKNNSLNKEGNKDKSFDSVKDKSSNSSRTQHEEHFGNDFNTSKKIKKKNISLSDVSTSKKSKEDSIINKLNLTSSGKEKKAKASKTEKDNNVSKKVTENEDSSDEIDFKLLFTQDESSGDSYTRKKTKSTDTKTNPTMEKYVLSKTDSLSKTKTKKAGQLTEEVDVNDLTHAEDKKTQKTKSEKKHRDTEMAEAEYVQPEQAIQEQAQEKSRKRKRREVIPVDNNNKVYLTHDENKVKVKKLPQGILQKLADKIEIFPTENSADKNAKSKAKSAISTSHFEVQTVIPRKNKPSQYLEDSVHMDWSPKPKEEIRRVKRPKVLPSVPKASTSTIGFTSNFKVNIMKQDSRHDVVLAGPEHIVNFKTQRFSKVKRIATEDLCRTNKRIRMKF